MATGNFGTQKILNEESRNAPRVRFRKRLQRLDSDVIRQQNDRWHENCREQKTAPEKMEKKILSEFLPPIETALHRENDEKNNFKCNFQTSKGDLLRSIPSTRIHKSHRLLIKGQQCCICLSPYQRGELVRTLPICGHSFHSGCLKRWTENHGWFAVCPIDGSCIATSERLTDGLETVSGRASSGMSTKPSLEQGKLSEEALKSLSSTFIVKRLLIPANQQYESPEHNGTGKEERKGKDGNDERTVTRQRRRSKKSPRPSPPPPLLIQLCPRNPSVETSAATSSENVVPVAEKEEYRVAYRKRATAPRLPGYKRDTLNRDSTQS